MSLALVEIETGIEGLDFVRGSVDGRMTVDEMRAEVQRLAEVVDGELAETWGGGGVEQKSVGLSYWRVASFDYHSIQYLLVF